MIASPGRRRHRAIAGLAVILLASVSGAAVLAGQVRPAPGSSGASASPYPGVGTSMAVSAGLPAIATRVATIPAPAHATAEPTRSAGPTFQPIDVFATPSPAPARGAQPTDPAYAVDVHRTIPAQSPDWLRLKAAGRVSLAGGLVVILDGSVDPLIAPDLGLKVPNSRQLDTDWTRWVVEPPGYGRDEKGSSYSNLNYWNMCSPGATTVALYYWQQLTGHPDVTGMSGYFVEPYSTEASGWPSPGPSEPLAPDGSRLGTYWSGTDTVSGFTANGRGFLMYLATRTDPPVWNTTGMVVYAGSSGQPLYPTRGGPRPNIVTALNWEASGREPIGWAQTWYTSVIRPDPTLARDLTMAVTLDVGRDGVPVIAAVDTYGLPNWQAGAATPHIRHAVAIVGYDNAAQPPTFTYIDTCGRACNARGGNQNGQLHVVSQAGMVAAIQDQAGSGFAW